MRGETREGKKKLRLRRESGVRLDLCIFLHRVILRINHQANLELQGCCGLALLGSWAPHIPLVSLSQGGGEQRKKVESEKMGV